jgi:hypothetical protein
LKSLGHDVERFNRWAGSYVWLLADFVASGLMRYVRRLLNMRQFPERSQLEALLQPVGLRIVANRGVGGLRGQVPVLAIGLST